MAMQNQQITADQHAATIADQTAVRPKVRIFHQFEGLENGSLVLGKEQAHYLAKVLRMQTGAIIGLFNQDAGEWACEIENLSKSQVVLTMHEQVRAAQTLPPIELAFAPLRKERMAFLIEKAVELGVTQLQPLTTEFTNWKFNADKMEKTVMEAIEQCERVDLPSIKLIQSLDAYLQGDQGLIYAAVERDTTASPIKALDNLPSTPRLLIGPEGGWSAREREMLDQHKRVQGIWLGDLILRAETAGIVGLALLQSRRNMM